MNSLFVSGSRPSMCRDRNNAYCVAVHVKIVLNVVVFASVLKNSIYAIRL